MNEARIHGRIEDLVSEEHSLWEREAAGEATDTDRPVRRRRPGSNEDREPRRPARRADSAERRDRRPGRSGAKGASRE